MTIAIEGATRVGRKKRPIPARVVKLDADIVGTAEMLAKRSGITVADYLSRILRPIMDREWNKMVRKASEEENE